MRARAVILTQASLALGPPPGPLEYTRRPLPPFLYPRPQKHSFPVQLVGRRTERECDVSGLKSLWGPGAAPPQAREGPAAPWEGDPPLAAWGSPWLWAGLLGAGWGEHRPGASFRKSPRRHVRTTFRSHTEQSLGKVSDCKTNL